MVFVVMEILAGRGREVANICVFVFLVVRALSLEVPTWRGNSVI